jgi:pimeloyl-ACP methyl ester carboxylesterase
MLFPQFSPRPWSLPADVLLEEMRSYAASPCFDALLDSLVYGPEQQGASGLEGSLVIGWGRQDRICLPRQATRAQAAFPSGRLHWFESCGHFPHWDQPEECVRLVLDATSGTKHF